MVLPHQVHPLQGCCELRSSLPLSLVGNFVYQVPSLLSWHVLPPEGACCTKAAMCIGFTCRCLDPAAAAAHIGGLHKACVNIMHLEALAAPDCQACDVPLRHQLSALTATLLCSIHPQLMTSLCSSIVLASALPHHCLHALDAMHTQWQQRVAKKSQSKHVEFPCQLLHGGCLYPCSAAERDL